MKPWTLATSVVATVLYVAALSDEFYRLTSPPTLSWHVVLRKAYSVVAFAAVAYLARRAFAEHGRPNAAVSCIVLAALYSALIEVGQWLAGSHEGLAWNAADVVCGALGGVVAAGYDMLSGFVGQRRRRSA